MRIEGSALDAMHALCVQLDERLRRNEDYRALKALEQAIDGVRAEGPGAAQSPLALPEPSLILPQIAAAVALPVNGPSALMQRLGAHYGPFTTAKAAIAKGDGPAAKVTALAETLKAVLKDTDAAA